MSLNLFDFRLNFFSSAYCPSLCWPTSSLWVLRLSILACILHSIRHVIWPALCPHVLGGVPGCDVPRYAPSHTYSDEDTRQGEMQWVFVLPLLHLQLHLLVCHSPKKIYILFPSLFIYVVIGTSGPEIFQIIKETLMWEMRARANTEHSF